MSNKKKHKGKKLSSELRQSILQLFQKNPKRVLNYKQIASLMEVSDPEIRKLIYSVLKDLSKEELLQETQRGKFRKATVSNQVEGIIHVSRRGAGFLVSDELDEDLYIDKRYMDKVMNGDKVIAEIRKGGRRKMEGVIVEVVGQKERKFVGTLEISEKFAFLVPEDARIDIDIFIPLAKVKNVENGAKAVARITDWPDSAKSPFGEIIEVLGSSDSHEVEMKSILIAYGIKYEFPDAVLDEADRIPISLDEDEIRNRKDFRDVLTITIDPVDARDFDDALSVEFLKNGNYKIGVHIADVGHYIREGSALDKEAFDRGNSVYLVDRVIPMLPEHLSNGVCSLRPDEEKFTFSAVFELDDNAEIVDEWFGKTVIKSDHRYAYEDAQEIIESGEGPYAKEILLLDRLAKILRKRKREGGALEILGSELRFELDEDGNPIKTYKKVGKDANKLIEEFMLLANRRVGRFIGDTNRKITVPLIYRIHDKPDKEKVEQFSVFMSKFGKSFKFKGDRDIALQMNKLFHEMKDEPEFAMVQQMAIKSMAKAVYDTENIGHYGLGFRYYAHFTSPIRRYADLMVHRILLNELNKKQKHYPSLREMAKHISVTERRAIEAERASQKYFQAQFLKDDIGKEYAGVVTGITEWGIYVEMKENYCEGMVQLKSLKNDRYYFDEKSYSIIGSRTGFAYNVGDIVQVELIKVSIAKKQIDLEIIE